MTHLSLPPFDEAQDLADFFDNAAIGLHWVGPDGTILRANRTELEMLGYRADEYVGRNIVEFHAEKEVIADILRRLAAGETVRDREARMRCKDDTLKWVLITSNVQWRDGQFVHTRCFTRDITERKRAEELEQRTVDYLEGLMEGFVAYDGNWVMTYMNGAAERLLRRKRADVLGKTWHEAFPHALGNPVDEMYQRVMRTRAAERMEYNYAHYRCWFEISASPVKDGGVAVYFRDITDRKQAEKALHESELRYRIAAGAANDLVWDADLATKDFVAEEGALQLFGYGRGPLKVDAGWGDRQVHPEDRARVRSALRNAIVEGAELWQDEFRFRRADGSYADVSARGQIVRDESGWAVRFIGSLTDLTVRKRAEEALREETRTLETLNRIGKTLAAELDLERVVQAVTDAATELSGAKFGAFFYNMKNEAGEAYMLYTLSGVSRSAFADFPMPRNTALFGPTFAGEAVVRSDDVTRDPRYGKSAPHHGMPKGHLPVRSYLAVPVVARSGEVIGGLFFGHPEPGVFTERAERLVCGIASQAAIAIDNARLYGALRKSERIYRAIGESIDYGIWICDPDGRNVYASESFLKLVGLTQEQCSDFGWSEVLHPEDAERTIAAWKECVRAGALWDIEHRFRGVDGEWHPVLARGAPVRDERGEILCWAGINLDISRLKRVEQALREADRRKDEFLATLAHELRNPLAPIRNGLQLLRLARPDTDIAEQAQAMMERQVNHLIRLVDDLMEVSRITRGKIALRRQSLDLSAVVLSAVETSRPAIGAARHKLDISLPPEPLTLQADFVRLSQVFANLLNNAAKYTPEGGRIALSARREGAEAVISVRDSGVGMPRDMLERVFEMFTQIDHSLSRAQGGLGIGLTLARSLVELHGGRIEAHSDGPGTGSEFVVRLPLAAATDSAAGSDDAGLTPQPSRRRLRILLADDNEDAARSLALILEHMGHCVELAYDGDAAVQAAERRRPDVVLVDLSMPLLDGHEVLRRLKAQPQFGEVRFIALTGRGRDEDRRRSFEVGFDEHLVKPVSAEALCSLLERF